MAAEWSPHEDLRPAASLVRVQPELTARGKVWTQLVWFELNGTKAYTQLTIRDCQGEWLLGHARIWPVVDEGGE